ncbi:MAG: ATP-dependent Clp protease proteolytic subunit, partial [Anaerolineales bacterium]|nr:ATP-dependent Clp protease proteolytic subunit [Anaerolineales bacterium]
TIHLHQPLGGAEGQATDIEIQTKEILRLRDKLNGILSLHTGQSVEKVKQDTDRDYWLTAHEAVEYGLIDKVLEPSKDSIFINTKQINSGGKEKPSEE